MFNNKKILENRGVYIHVPFCVKKCAYCDFLSFPASSIVHREYVDSLIREIRFLEIKFPEIKSSKAPIQKNSCQEMCFFDEKLDISSIFIGGGTPSIVEEMLIFDIMQAIYQTFSVREDAEITIECNPGTIDENKIKFYKEVGINRISFGLQSASDELLARIGRIHTYCDFLSSYECARNAGFDNINIDMMSALPGQTLDMYKNDIQKIVKLNPEHISAYSLILEENTPLYEHIDLYPSLPDEEMERQMYYDTKKILLEHQYHRYEISNYAKAGYECRHNKLYWERGDYMGFGLGAASFIQGVRYKNTENMEEYMKKAGKESVVCEQERLSKKDCMSEFMFLGLRESKGVCANAFKAQFGVSIHEIFGNVLKKHIDQKLIYSYSLDKGRQIWYALTDYGVDISNYVFSEYLLE